MRKNKLLLFFVLFFLIGFVSFTNWRIFALFSNEEKNQNDFSYKPPSVPETLEQERPKVQAIINELCQALKNKNVDKIVELCNEQEGYREKFEQNKDNFSLMAESLKTARLTHLADGYCSYGERVGQITVDVGSRSFALPIVKIKGKWFFQDL